MAEKNDGSEAEKRYRDYVSTFGKLGFIERLPDTKKVIGMLRAIGQRFLKIKLDEQPSDYIECIEGVMALAEVKSTSDPLRFNKALIKKNQINAARRLIAAGGLYWFVIHSIAHRQWFKVPAAYILSYPAGSIPWAELSAYRLDIARSGEAKPYHPLDQRG